MLIKIMKSDIGYIVIKCLIYDLHIYGSRIYIMCIKLIVQLNLGGISYEKENCIITINGYDL